MHMELETGMNLLGVLAFAFTGATKAIDKQLDILGIFTLGLATALGGGIVRDALIHRTINAFSAFSELTFAVLGVIAAAVIYKKFKEDLSSSYYVMIPDAIGLAIFTLTGASIAYQAGILGPGMIFLAALTAVGGGVIADLLIGRIPAVLKEDCYATCSIAGGFCFYVAIQISTDLAVTSFLTCFTTLSLRILAIQGRWSLPKITD